LLQYILLFILFTHSSIQFLNIELFLVEKIRQFTTLSANITSSLFNISLIGNLAINLLSRFLALSNFSYSKSDETVVVRDPDLRILQEF
jgi:hypothetical protein